MGGDHRVFSLVRILIHHLAFVLCFPLQHLHTLHTNVCTLEAQFPPGGILQCFSRVATEHRYLAILRMSTSNPKNVNLAVLLHVNSSTSPTSEQGPRSLSQSFSGFMDLNEEVHSAVFFYFCFCGDFFFNEFIF